MITTIRKREGGVLYEYSLARCGSCHVLHVVRMVPLDAPRREAKKDR